MITVSFIYFIGLVADFKLEILNDNTTLLNDGRR